jgi:hypothetical protein
MIGTVRAMRRDEIESSKSPVTQISLVIDSATRSRPETSIVDLDSRARRQKYGTPDNLFNHWNRKQHFLQSSAFSCWVLRFTALSLQVGPLGGAVSLIREVSGGLLREISPSSRRDSSATVWIITIVGLFNSGIRRIRWPRVAGVRQVLFATTAGPRFASRISRPPCRPSRSAGIRHGPICLAVVSRREDALEF